MTRIPRPIYGLDIAIDIPCDESAHQPLDPAGHPIVSLAVSGVGDERVFTGDEESILVGIDRFLARCEPGVIATWNGSAFSLPMLADRARFLGVDLGLRLEVDRRGGRRIEFVQGHRDPYRAAWHNHQHCDLARLSGSPRRRRSDVDDVRERSRLKRDSATSSVSNDARLVRVLAESKLGRTSWHIDRITETRPPTWALRLDPPRRARPPRSPAHPAVRAMFTSPS